jgi:hypothetical protein
MYLFTMIIEGNDFIKGVECWDPPYALMVGERAH